MTPAQINWLITGNINGDLGEATNFRHNWEDMKDHLDSNITLFENSTISVQAIHAINEMIESAPVYPSAPYPSRNISPSAYPSNTSIPPDGFNNVDRNAQNVISTIPSSVLNIPDPAFSRRGGENISNTRTITIKNRNYDPKSKDPENQKEYIQVEVPDIGVGSGDMQKMVEAAESDRVLSSIPLKVYAPVHPVAVDRYLGVRNFRRLSVDDETYFEKFSEHGWTKENVNDIYQWNQFIMGTYGPMLYVFSTDENKSNTPIFDITTPDAVIYEFKELNELMKELQRYQEKSTDRAERAEDGGSRPLETALNEFFDKRQEKTDEEGGLPPNAIVIQGDNPFDVDPNDKPQDLEGEDESNVNDLMEDYNMYSKDKSGAPVHSNAVKLPINDEEMDFGFFRPPAVIQKYNVYNNNTNSVTPVNDDMSKRHKMFHGFSRR